MKSQDNPIIKVISRNSPLALLQVGELAALFPELRFEVEEVSSYGDRHKNISLMATGIAEDFFTRELDSAVLDGTADIAVHSAKDLPYPLPEGIELYCLTEASDKSDSLVSRCGTKLSDLPPGSRIGTSSSMRKAELLRLRPDIEVVSIRGTIEERIAQVDSGHVDALIVATCALQRLGLAHRAAERLPFKTHPLQGHLAVTGRCGRPELKARFGRHDMRRAFGRVTLVGFGPGDPELLTLAGDRALATADVIFYDDLIDRSCLRKYAAEQVYVGKRQGRHSHAQAEINELLYQAALAGRQAVRLKGGDPMVFAHGREEIDFLRRRFVEVSVIPGVSSGIALAACTHIPLTHRGVASSVAFVSGHGDAPQAPDADTLVYYMGGTNLRAIAATLLERGRDAATPVALVYNVSRPDQRTFYATLGELRHAFVKYPTPLLAIVGKVVALEGQRFSRSILATGTAAPQEGPGERVAHTPLITISPAPLTPAISDCLRRLDYDWIVFTSRHGVRCFLDLLREAGTDVRRLAGIRIASVGAVTTAALAAGHLRPDVESATASAEGLLDWFSRRNMAGQRVLLPRSDRKLAQLSDGLAALGCRVTDLTVYCNRTNREAPRVTPADYSEIIFSSPSGVEAFKEIYGDLPEGPLLVAKGKTTANKLQELL